MRIATAVFRSEDTPGPQESDSVPPKIPLLIIANSYWSVHKPTFLQDNRLLCYCVTDSPKLSLLLFVSLAGCVLFKFILISVFAGWRLCVDTHTTRCTDACGFCALNALTE